MTDSCNDSAQHRCALGTVAAAIFVAALLATPVAARAATIRLSACGAVPDHAIAYLSDDVTCALYCASDPATVCDPNSPGRTCPSATDTCVPAPITLGNGAQLRLNGHTIRTAHKAVAIACGSSPDQRGTCTIVGPGRVTASSGIGVAGGAMNVTLRNLTIDETTTAVTTKGKLSASYVDFSAPRQSYADAVSAGGTMVLRNVVLGSADRVEAAGNVFVSNITVYAGLRAGGDVRGSGVVLVTHGIVAKNIYLRDAFAEYVDDAPGGLVASNSLRLTNSSITGNASRPGNPDIVSGRRPVLIRSVCDNSERYDDPDSTWDVCRDD
jgi:hypothetical protein